MIFLFFALNEHVVHIDLYVPPNLLAKHPIYQSLVCGPRILQTERHNPVAIVSLAGDEGGLLLILLCHLYLVVFRESVHRGKKLVPYRRVHKLVNPG